MSIDKKIDDLLCRLTTGYTRHELLTFSEEDTGLDKLEVVEELKSVDKAIISIQALLQQTRLEAYKKGYVDAGIEALTKFENENYQ